MKQLFVLFLMIVCNGNFLVAMERDEQGALPRVVPVNLKIDMSNEESLKTMKRSVVAAINAGYDVSTMIVGVGNEPLLSVVMRLDAIDETALRYLIKHSSTVDVCNAQGVTPLMEAAFWGQCEAVKLLLEKTPREKVDQLSNYVDRMTALGYAFAAFNMQAYLERFPLLNADIDKEGFIARQLAIIQMLVAHGASLNIGIPENLKNHAPIWRSPLDIARRLKIKPLEEFIAKHLNNR